MRREFRFLLLAGLLASNLSAQRAFTWQELRDRLAATNPTLQAGQINIDESRAAEITAYLRPNPDFSLPWMAFKSPRTRASGVRSAACGNARRQLPARTRAQAGIAARDQAKSPRPSQKPIWIRSAIWCSTCGTRSSRPCRPRRCSERARKSGLLGRELANQPGVSAPATWRKWIWTAWSCSEFSLKPDLKRRW